MKELSKIVGKTKIDRIRNRQIGESCCIRPIDEWVESRRREWDEHVKKIDVERFGTTYLPEEDFRDFRKENGAT